MSGRAVRWFVRSEGGGGARRGEARRGCNGLVSRDSNWLRSGGQGSSAASVRLRPLPGAFPMFSLFIFSFTPVLPFSLCH